MVLKAKQNFIYNLIIAILISLLMLMLYLGNYNLIEGNDTSSQVMSNLDALLENNKAKAKNLQDNTAYKSACSSKENMNEKNADAIRNIGGAGNPASQSLQKANQTLASICSKNT
jgi:hypothetical protein